MFDDDQETPNTINCAWEFNEGGKRKMMEFEVRHWMTNGEASVGDPTITGTGGSRWRQHRRALLRIEGISRGR